MKTDIPPQRPRGARRIPGTETGFALIVTLTLMILLTILAVGLLSLSSVSLRVSSQEEAMSTARANARVALMLALGELQLQTGLDTRVTARADVLDEKSPPILGVWKSWEGKDHESTGRPISPASNYRSTKEKDYFLAWLNSESIENPSLLPDGTAGKNTVILVGTGSVGTGTVAGRTAANRQVHLTPTPVNAGRLPGKVAWWIGGENQKARLPKPYQLSEDSAAQWATQSSAHNVADPEPYRMESLLDDATPAPKAITLQQADLIAKKGKSSKASQEFFYDLSAVSTGLLTNTATGGWRKDLSLFSESWTSQPASGLPLFHNTPNQDCLYTKPTAGNPHMDKSLFYPWASFRGDMNGGAPLDHSPVASWMNMMDFVNFYRSLDPAQNTPPIKISYRSGKSITSSSALLNDYDYHHKVRIMPVLARYQFIFSHSVVKLAPTSTGTTQYEPRCLVTPVITLWNPYNVEISCLDLMFSFSGDSGNQVIAFPMPTALKYTIGGTSNTGFHAITNGINGWGNWTIVNNKPALTGYTRIRCSMSDPGRGSLKLGPGEARIYSPTNIVPVEFPQNGGARGDPIIPLTPGYRPGGGFSLQIARDNTSPYYTNMAGTDSIAVAAAFDTTINNSNDGVNALGVYIEGYLSTDYTYNRYYSYRLYYPPARADELYPKIPSGDLLSGSLSEFEAPRAFLSTVFGARVASDNNYATKGYAQANPLIHFTQIALPNSTKYKGMDNPINSPFCFSLIKHTGLDSYLPDTDASNSGYIVSGFNKSNGLSRCVALELPLRPLVSLAELNHWDMRYENPYPPFALNLIGNSDASPLISPNSILAAGTAGDNYQVDDSYCANHLLFDDWFVSSITADPSSFGSTIGRNQKTTYTDFVKGTTPLSTRAYQALLEDRAAVTADSAEADQLYTEKVAPLPSYRSIASRLEVEGMFNVNSTSVTAWRALLGHARNQKIPYISATGDLAISGVTDYATSRFSVAGDVQAGLSGASAFPEASEFTGYRVLDDKLLDSLAEQVVVQIRKRGPFLSLAEFINRQLSNDDKTLAVAGALQAALNTLTDGGVTNNPLSKVQNLSKKTDNPAGSDYVFPEAAVGYSSYGLPGWPRQVDILKPLAPILSARDDTFTIRAYGDARDAQGKVLARSVCEAVVRRTREFVDPTEDAAILTAPTKTLNKKFGRRYQIVSFRWLSPNEV